MENLINLITIQETEKCFKVDYKKSVEFNRHSQMQFN